METYLESWTLYVCMYFARERFWNIQKVLRSEMLPGNLYSGSSFVASFGRTGLFLSLSFLWFWTLDPLALPFWACPCCCQPSLDASGSPYWQLKLVEAVAGQVWSNLRMVKWIIAGTVTFLYISWQNGTVGKCTCQTVSITVPHSFPSGSDM